MTIEIILERTKQSLLEFPKETICTWSATDFEKETAEVLSRWYEVDYREGSQRFPDIEIEDWGVECKKSIHGWRCWGNSVKHVKDALERLIEIWYIYLNQKTCEIRYSPHERCALEAKPDIRYRHIVNMN